MAGKDGEYCFSYLFRCYKFFMHVFACHQPTVLLLGTL